METENQETLCLLCCCIQTAPDGSTFGKADATLQFSFSAVPPKCIICSRCQSLMSLAQASKRTLEDTERDVRRRQVELLAELRKLEDHLRVFKHWMQELDQAIRGSSASVLEKRIDKHVTLSNNKVNLLQFRAKTMQSRDINKLIKLISIKAVHGLQTYYQQVFGNDDVHKGSSGSTKRNQDEADDAEDITASNFKAEFVSNVSDEDDNEPVQDALATPSGIPSKIKDEALSEDEPVEEGFQSGFNSDEDCEDKNDNDFDLSVKGNVDSDGDTDDVNKTADSPNSKITQQQAPVPKQQQPCPNQKLFVPKQKGNTSQHFQSASVEFVTGGNVGVNSYWKQLSLIVGKFPLFKEFILKRVLYETGKRQALSTSVEVDAIDPQLLLSKYFLEYNINDDTLHIRNVPILINDSEQYLQCGVCQYKTPKSTSKMYGYTGPIERDIYDHILCQHLDAFKCPICSRKWETKNQFIPHVSNHAKTTKRLSVERVKRICDICGKPSFCMEYHKWSHKSDEEKLQANIARGTPDLNTKWPFQCDICGKKNICSQRALKQHQATLHDPELEHQLCSKCGKSILATVMQVHKAHCDREKVTKQKMSHECHRCPKTFRAPKDLRLHLFLHHPNPSETPILKYYGCKKCPKRFTSKSGLTDHNKRSHVRDPPLHTCVKNCGQTFKSRQGRRAHEKTCDGVPLSSIDLTCKTCGKICKSKGKLALHSKSHLPKKKRTLLCSHCPMIFSSRNHLNRHLRRVSGERPYICRKGCGSTFAEAKSRSRHDKACTGKGTGMYRNRRTHAVQSAQVTPSSSSSANDAFCPPQDQQTSRMQL